MKIARPGRYFHPGRLVVIVLCLASTSANCLQIAKIDVGRDPARDHLAETIMVEAVAWSVKHSKSQKLLL